MFSSWVQLGRKHTQFSVCPSTGSLSHKFSYPNNLMCVHAQLLSCIWFFVTPWTVAHQAHLSMGFFTQKYWSGLPFPSPGVFLIQRSNPCLLYLLLRHADIFTAEPPGNPLFLLYNSIYMSVPISQFIPSLPYPLVNLFSTSVTLSLFCE